MNKNDETKKKLEKIIREVNKIDYYSDSFIEEYSKIRELILSNYLLFNSDDKKKIDKLEKAFKRYCDVDDNDEISKTIEYYEPLYLKESKSKVKKILPKLKIHAKVLVSTLFLLIAILAVIPVTRQFVLSRLIKEFLKLSIDITLLQENIQVLIFFVFGLIGSIVTYPFKSDKVNLYNHSVSRKCSSKKRIQEDKTKLKTKSQIELKKELDEIMIKDHRYYNLDNLREEILDFDKEEEHVKILKR